MLNNEDGSLFRHNKDIKDKLNGCIIRYNRLPVLATASGETNMLLICSLKAFREESPDAREIRSSDPGLDVSSIPLGFLNFGGLYWISRLPHRRYKYGIHHENLRIRTYPFDVPRMVSKKVLYSQEMEDMLLNIYPPFNTARELLGKSSSGVAFARSFALILTNDGVSVFHKTKQIGILNKDRCILTGGFANSMTQRMLEKHGVTATC